MKKLIITEETVDMEVPEDEGITLEDMTIMALNALGGAVKNICEVTTSEHPESLAAVREELFDMFNMQFSYFLDTVFQEIALRPNLTEEAILRAENEIIKEKAEEAGITLSLKEEE